MTVNGYVYDNLNRVYLPGASVTVVNSAGTPLGGGIDADNTGHFQITDNNLDAGAKLLFSNVGYTSVIMDPGTVVATGFVGLDESADTLQAAVVTAKAPTAVSNANYLPYIAAGGGLLLLWLASGKKKKAKMGDTGGSVMNVVLIGGVAVGAYVFVIKPILQKFGLAPTAQQVATSSAQASALAAAQAAAKQTGTTAETYTIDQYTGWANDIFTIATATSGGVPQDAQDKIVTDVINVNTMVDLQQLISAFGQRQANCLIFGLDCTTYDLPGFLKAALDTIHINKINGYLDDQGINYQF